MQVLLDATLSDVLQPLVIVAKGHPQWLPAHEAWLAEALEQAAAAPEALWPEGLKGQVRRMLRFNKFRASGRNKPASEFLLQAAGRAAFPRVNPWVDLNNLLSLALGVPSSVFDGEALGESIALRRAAAGESYIFNHSGHRIELRDLLCVYRQQEGDWEACGNPVKDSMATKLAEDADHGVFVLYLPKVAGTQLLTRCQDLCLRAIELAGLQMKTANIQKEESNG